MYHASSQDWANAPSRRIAVFGMSGLGKTVVSNMLRETGAWFHYSVDFRIGTRYMGEHIVDNFKREAMKVPLLRELLMSDSIYIGSNISFANLDPLSTYLGKPGDESKGGIPFVEYQKRQNQHREAEIAALLDTPKFIDKSKDIYGYSNFICDTGGSICEVVDPWDKDDAVMTVLSQNLLPVWLKGSEEHADELARRFAKAPKPIYYRPEMLLEYWAEYLAEKDITPEKVDPDDFVRWGYRRQLAARQPRYQAMADNFGVTIDANDLYRIKTPQEFLELVGAALEAR